MCLMDIGEETSIHLLSQSDHSMMPEKEVLQKAMTHRHNEKLDMRDLCALSEVFLRILNMKGRMNLNESSVQTLLSMLSEYLVSLSLYSDTSWH